MSKCSFCSIQEDEQYPICKFCGALRYPIEKNSSVAQLRRQQRLKLSASVAAALVTPGAFVVLAVMGASHISAKIKKSTKFNP